MGVARADLSDEAFRADLTEGIKQFATAGLDEKIWADLVANMSYVRGNFDDPDSYKRLKAHLAEVSPAEGAPEQLGNILFYLATAADYFAEIVDQLKQRRAQRRAGRRLAPRHRREAVRP